jgi:hypothetical protein
MNQLVAPARLLVDVFGGAQIQSSLSVDRPIVTSPQIRAKPLKRRVGWPVNS